MKPRRNPKTDPDEDRPPEPLASGRLDPPRRRPPTAVGTATPKPPPDRYRPTRYGAGVTGLQRAARAAGRLKAAVNLTVA
jgi:hypothetical protein